MKTIRTAGVHPDRWFRLIPVLYFLFLLIVLWVFGYTPTNDGEGYIELARDCMNYGEPYPCKVSIEGQPFIWNIGSINMVILSLSLFGTIYPVLLLMCGMKALTAYFITGIARKVFSDKVALITLLIYVLYPNYWGQSTTLLPEIPSEFFMFSAFYVIFSRQSRKMMVLAGVLLALSNWFRPNVALMIVLLSAWLFFFHRTVFLKKIPLVLTACIVSLAAIGTECYLRTGHFVFQAQTYWYNMVDQCYDGAPAAPHFGMDTTSEGKSRYIKDREKKTCFECNEIWKRRSIEWLRGHMAEYLGKIPPRLYYLYMNDIDNMAAFLADKENAENNYVLIPYRHILTEWNTLTPVQWFSFVTTLFYALIMLMAVAAFLVYAREGRLSYLSLPLVMAVAGSFIFVLLVHAETRYKDSFMPFIIMMSACFLAYLFRNRQSLENK